MTKLKPYQKVGVKKIEKYNGRVLLADAMGLGKAQPLSAKILTANGWIYMKDVHIGTKVFGSDGKEHKVIGVFPQGKQKIYRVLFSDRSSTYCTLDHLWQIQTPSMKWHDTKSVVLPLKEFKDKLTYKNGNRKFFIPMVSAIEFPERQQPLDPYVFGVLIGDGCLKYGISLSSPDEDIREEVSKQMPKYFRLAHTGGCDYRISRPKEHAKTPNVLNQIFKKMDLRVGTAKKYIPKVYKYASVKQRIALLQGLLDTDGYIATKKGCDSSHTDFTTVSPRLAKDVRFIIQSLGGTARITSYMPAYTYKGEKRIGQKAYRVSFSVPASIIPFRCKRRLERFVPKSKYQPTRAFVKVEYAGEEECQCIRVDSPDHLYVTDNCILTHNTLQALTYLKNHPELRPAIIICPASVKWVWEWQAKKHCHLHASVLSGRKVPKYTLTNPDPIMILNYDILDAWKDYLKAIKPLIVLYDEAHNAKSPKAQRTKALKALCKNVPHVIAISGTPLTNRPAELFSTLNILWPKEFPAFTPYAHTFCAPKWKPWGWDYRGAGHLDVLHGKIKKLGMIRRLKEDVLKDLPSKTRIVVPMEIGNVKEYEQAVHEFIKWLSKRSPGKAQRASKAEELVKVGYLVRLASELKMKYVFEWVDNFFEESDGKLVLFCHHKKIVNMLKERYKDICTVITGATSQKKRKIAVQNFQKNKKTRLFIGNIRAAGTGIDLFAASTVAFVETGYVPGDLQQCEDRLHRIGQKRNVTVYYLIAKDTIETNLCKILQRKHDIVTQILDGKRTRKDSRMAVHDELIKEIRKGKI